jgi:hypothetical protein
VRLDRVTHLLTASDDPASLAARSRRTRSARLLTAFPDLAEMTVIDLGGVVGDWDRMPVHPAHVTVVNLMEQAGDERTSVVVGDACTLPHGLRGRRFDLVFSNSVIDQVGGHHRRLQFAQSVKALADRHWIQTAYRYFPLDAMTLVPLQQQLPLVARAWLARNWPLGYRHADAWPESVGINLAVEGLSRTACAFYFPESKIISERWAGLVKSLIAVRR